MTRETAAIQDFLLEESRASRIPGTDEVAQDLLSTLRAGISPIVNALSTILFLLSSLFVMLFFATKTRKKIF